MDTIALPTDMASLRTYFNQGNTLSYSFRKEQLKKLKAAIKQNEKDILEALHADMHKPAFEAFTSEIGVLYEEIDFMLKHLKYWMKPKSMPTPFVHFPSSSKIIAEPLGVVLIIAPWNYPFQLLIAPLIGAMAAGNCAVLKPSEETPHTAKIIEKIITENFSENYIKVMQGIGAEVVPAMIENFRFDHIFFTGSVPVGQKIAEMAAKELVPTTLELGGKSPVIVDKDVNVSVAAKRIAWGKFFNAGQTCISPDYLLVHEAVKDKLMQKMVHYINEFYGENPAQSPDYAKIINQKRFRTLSSYLNQGNIITGGVTDESTRFIAPTLLDNVRLDDPVMQEEIFGPILPILTYQNLDEAFEIVNTQPFPLSLYVFSNDKKFEKSVLKNISFGGGAINITLVHFVTPHLPFGGVGYSGMGRYHGKYSFDTFSHQKSIMKTKFIYENSLRYAPYKKWQLKIAKWLF